MSTGNNPMLESFMRGQGIIAEASLVFYRAVIGAGASQEEAIKVTQAYIAALLFGHKKEDEK